MSARVVWSRAAPYAFVASAFVGSRWFYRNVVGVRFDTKPTTYFIQYIDQWFLENHFWQSLLYLHHQAPLQNLLVGGSVRLFGEALAFQLLEGLYTLLGFGTALGLVHASLRLGVQRYVAALVSAAYAASPGAVFYENLLFYHQPVCFCLVLTVLALLRYQHRPGFRTAFGLFSAITVLALFRNTFGPAFLLAAFGLLWFQVPLGLDRARTRRLLLGALAAPMALLCLNTLKPRLVTGHDHASIMVWGNLAAKIRNALPPAEYQRLTRSGEITGVSAIFGLTDLKELGAFRVSHPKTGVPLLDETHTPSGRWNAHALEYLLITEKFYHPEAAYLLRKYPGTYLASVATALAQFTGSVTDDSVMPGTENYGRLKKLNARLDGWLMRRHDRMLVLMVCLPLLFAYGASRVLSPAARRASQLGLRATLAFVLLVIGYTTLVYVAVSCGDFSRYRFDIDPLFLLLLGLLATDLLQLAARAPVALRSAVRRVSWARAVVPSR